ncbi:MAG: hypothetical protein ACE5PV_19585, partial [Candidatus Poribacteria bacterium]
MAMDMFATLTDDFVLRKELQMKHENSGDFPEFNAEARRIWDANAEWWDDKIGDGNEFQCELIEPAT